MLLSLTSRAEHPVEAFVEPHKERIVGTADALWEFSELGYLETQSSDILQQLLAEQGFSIEKSVAEIPTAFIASYGEGRPVIAILGEFDALPGISQAAVPYPSSIDGKPNGQACGHNLFGAGSMGAALAVKDWLDQTGSAGTVRFYGTPAEEGGSGKVYMVRAGLFDDVDAALHWHPASINGANAESSLANKSAKFRFRGVSSHAARAPERGRSALDGVEAMNYMVNLLREHVPEETRIHYVVTEGGIAPNVVPNFAESFYYVRHPNAAVLSEIWDRVIATAEAAAIGTGTELEYEVIHGNHSTLPNAVLAQLMHQQLTDIGAMPYDEAERAFALKIAETLPPNSYYPGRETEIQPFAESMTKGSTDVGDVSWNVPTAGMRTATFVPGTGLHSWQAVAAGGMSIGHKGALLAAKAIAATAISLMEDPIALALAKEEFERRRGANFQYRALLGDRDPPLDYRR
ncbi:MAG: amidohydrolase [Halieaceae bacterium]